jgi:phosphoglycerate kinase
LDTARAILDGAGARGCRIVLPTDVVVATQFKANAAHRTAAAQAVGADEMILDAGPQSTTGIETIFEASRTLVWNGPLGAFEKPPFDRATTAAAKHAAARTREGALLSVAGGGDTVAALNQAGVAGDFSYVSTAGGAFLEWLEGKALPGVEALRTA